MSLFELRRPALVMRGLFVNRDEPDLERLAAIREPERFVWAILPHAARTFSACIAMLPRRCALAAAVGYLYCRVLDTYEDLHPHREEREAALRAFAARLERSPVPAAHGIPATEAGDQRDLGHLLLVERCELVDRVFARLPAAQRDAIREVVTRMADGMCWSSETFDRQGGVLESEEQLARYCRNVLGHPVVFTLRLLRGEPVDGAVVEDGMRVGELIQVANITRDIEKDLARGVAYHPALRPYLWSDGAAVADEVRGELMRFALQRAPAYARMVDAIGFPAISFGRAAAVLMLLFTDRYYRGCARRSGIPPWHGPKHSFALLARTVPAWFSRTYSARVLRRIERAFVAASVATPRTVPQR